MEPALRKALCSIEHLEILEDDVDLVPVFLPRSIPGARARINVELWKRELLTKSVLQELATRLAMAFKGVVGDSRAVKVVIYPYDVGERGWISL